MKIIAVKLFEVKGNGKGLMVDESHAHPIDIYGDDMTNKIQSPEIKQRVISDIYVQVFTDSDISGLFGPIDIDQAHVIRTHLRDLVIGMDPLTTEKLFDQMIRKHRHGRTGLYMTGVSALDCALWDLKGKALGLPIYRILGGPVRVKIPVYASMLGFSTEPEVAADTAREYKEKGYKAQKWFFRFGPIDGQEGKARNMAMAKAVRIAVGKDYMLMFDAFMSWDLPYSVSMARSLKDIDPYWLEEPMPPERIGSFNELRAIGIPIATGEHVFTRWQVRHLLEPRAVDVIQTDPDWTGGISELIKICALTSSFDVPLVPHGHSLLPALQVAASQSSVVVPMVEYLVRLQDRKQFFHHPIFRPKNGLITVPDLPGIGIELDSAKISEKNDLG